MEPNKLKSFKDFVGVNTRQNIVELIRNVSSDHYTRMPAGKGPTTRYNFYYLALTTSPWISNDTIRIYNIPHFVDDGPLSRHMQPLIDALNGAGYTIANWRYEYDETTPQAKANLEAGYVDITFKNLQPTERLNESKLDAFKQFKFRQDVEDVIHNLDTFSYVKWITPKEIMVQDLPASMKIPHTDHKINPVVRSMIQSLKEKFGISFHEHDDFLQMLHIVFK